MNFITSMFCDFMLLVIDNGSIFTREIIKILSENQTKYSISTFDKVVQQNLNEFDSYILSGRRKNDKQMNALNSEIINHAISENKSLLGICYGAEILALTLGGTIRKSDETVKGLHKVNITAVNPLFEKDIQVYQSHSYEIAKLGDELESFASSDTCKHEIIRHHDLPLFGTQFHPEMSKDGKLLIESFLKIIH